MQVTVFVLPKSLASQSHLHSIIEYGLMDFVSSNMKNHVYWVLCLVLFIFHPFLAGSKLLSGHS